MKVHVYHVLCMPGFAHTETHTLMSYRYYGHQWSMTAPWYNCDFLHRLRKKDVETPQVVNVSVLEGHVSPSEGENTEMATVTTERWYMAPGVKRIDVRQHGLVGTLFLPPGEQSLFKNTKISTKNLPDQQLLPLILRRSRQVSRHDRPVGNGRRTARVPLCPACI